MWVTPAAIAAWHSPPTGKRGRSPHYSNIAIETGPLLRFALGRQWRPTEGLLRSVAILLIVSIEIPDHTTFSRRSIGRLLSSKWKQTAEPVHVVIDSIGLKVYGAGEWQAEKHGGRGRRTWRKLHLAVPLDSGEILASELTSNEIGDLSLVDPLLKQMERAMTSVMADGVYDGRAGLSNDCRISAGLASGSDHPAEGDRGAPSQRRHRTEPTRLAHSDHPGKRSLLLGEGGGLRPTFAGRNGKVPLQDFDRSHAARSHAPGAED